MEMKEILENHKKWLHGEEGGCHADLSGADLRYVNLSEANPRGVDLRHANLSGADLRHANLIGVDLRHADLSGAILCHANLCHADLSEAKLRGADLRHAKLRGVDLRGADLRHVNLWNCNGNQKQIKSLFILEKYSVVYTSEYLQIGCENHRISEWWEFDDKRIARMDTGALDWWKENKEFIRYVIEKYPAIPTIGNAPA